MDINLSGHIQQLKAHEIRDYKLLLLNMLKDLLPLISNDINTIDIELPSDGGRPVLTTKLPDDVRYKIDEILKGTRFPLA